MGRFTTYLLCSAGTVIAMLYHTYKRQAQFYTAAIALTNSKLSLLLLSNLALAATLLAATGAKTVFLGTLREAELEHLYERLWYTISETCLAMTIFREEFNAPFVAQFAALLLVKSFHWLVQNRQSYIEQYPATTTLTHARMLLLISLLGAIDVGFLHYAFSTSLQIGPSVLLLFAFEYLVLASTAVSILAKYALYANDLRLGGRWEDRGVYNFYLELTTDLFHVVVYLAFFIIVCIYYGLPLHILRDLYLTVHSFRSRVADFLRYRAIMRNVQERFPDATEEELEQSDRVCIICREHMDSAKKLRCGHMFHFHCLRSWIERQQTCPTCRAPIVPPRAGRGRRRRGAGGRRRRERNRRGGRRRCSGGGRRASSRCGRGSRR